jgi:hypothetical protein
MENPTLKNNGAAGGGASFARQADAGQTGFLVEMWTFIVHNKKWWLTPIILVLLAFGLLIALGGTAAAPFIYTLF